jgi:hypothetical protein
VEETRGEEVAEPGCNAYVERIMALAESKGQVFFVRCAIVFFGIPAWCMAIVKAF